MSSKELNELKWQRPFKPFRLKTVNHDVFDITDPGLILVAKHDINIGVPHPHEPPPSVSEVIWLDVEDVVDVEFIEAAAT
jgi:hypothetical protein